MSSAYFLSVRNETMLQDVTRGVRDAVCSESFVQNAQLFNVSGIVQSCFDGNFNSIGQGASEAATGAGPCNS